LCVKFNIAEVGFRIIAVCLIEVRLEVLCLHESHARCTCERNLADFFDTGGAKYFSVGIKFFIDHARKIVASERKEGLGLVVLDIFGVDPRCANLVVEFKNYHCCGNGT